MNWFIVFGNFPLRNTRSLRLPLANLSFSPWINIQLQLVILKKIQSIKNPPTKIMLCEWYIVWSQQSVYIHKACFKLSENNQLINASRITTLSLERTMNQRFNIIGLNLLSANPKKWSNTLKQFLGQPRRIVWVQ